MERTFPNVVDKPITKIINNQPDIKLGQFTQEKLNVVLTKIKNRKAAGLDEKPPEVLKTRKFDDILLRYCNAVYNQKGEIRIIKNYRGITHTDITAKIYNALLLTRIKPESE